MPLLDVSEILDDPDFSTVITILRTVEDVNNFGEATYSVKTFSNVSAVVTGDGGQALALLEDGSRISDSIVVHCKLPLQAGTPKLAADKVIWNGALFLVKNSRDWSQWGAGFYRAACEFLEYVEAEDA